MTKEMHQRVLGACLGCLIPIARVLLKHGVNYREFEKVCRRAFVQVASREFGVRGRETNTSRVSAMTGLPRKEVQRLKHETELEEGGIGDSLSPLADLLHIWATSPEFTESNGTPMDLLFASTGVGTFPHLVSKCIGDVPAGAVKAELLRLGVAEQRDGKTLRLLRRSLIPPGSDERLVSALTYSLKGLAGTIAHNNDPESPKSELRFERYVESKKLSEREIEAIRGVIRSRLEVISEELDSLMDPDEAAAPSVEGRRIGVGIYYSE